MTTFSLHGWLEKCVVTGKVCGDSCASGGHAHLWIGVGQHPRDLAGNQQRNQIHSIARTKPTQSNTIQQIAFANPMLHFNRNYHKSVH